MRFLPCEVLAEGEEVVLAAEGQAVRSLAVSLVLLAQGGVVSGAAPLCYHPVCAGEVVEDGEGILLGSIVVVT